MTWLVKKKTIKIQSNSNMLGSDRSIDGEDHNNPIMSAFRTCEDRQPTSEFVVACPYPDGLMQDGTQEGNEAYVISHRGARSRGYKRRERVRARARARERERVHACVRLCPSRLPRLPLCQRVST
jgi:hypothetical protein